MSPRAQTEKRRFGERESGIAAQGGVERLGVVGRFAFAVGARDHEHVFFRGEFGGVGLRHVENRRGKTAFAGFFRGFFGESLRRAGLRSEKNGERRQRLRRR